ncbi:hypothetical protein HDF13_003239 [Edaphobacter lichenicola]|uniref:Uncharacterized protein n=1 Tax=Tunturiibacter gelidiferens TaxID=3069689 RepID=A0ACC5P232_9BACT|nr:hypothetical protein [Edaphobacter lichenicola]
MSLLSEISQKRKEIKTDGYPMSIGEWISLYESKEVDIHPEFQRFFRWTPAQKTNLIESIRYSEGRLKPWKGPSVTTRSSGLIRTRANTKEAF